MLRRYIKMSGYNACFFSKDENQEYHVIVNSSSKNQAETDLLKKIALDKKKIIVSNKKLYFLEFRIASGHDQFSKGKLMVQSYQIAPKYKNGMFEELDNVKRVYFKWNEINSFDGDWNSLISNLFVLLNENQSLMNKFKKDTDYLNISDIDNPDDIAKLSFKKRVNPENSKLTSKPKKEEVDEPVQKKVKKEVKEKVEKEVKEKVKKEVKTKVKEKVEKEATKVKKEIEAKLETIVKKEIENLDIKKISERSYQRVKSILKQFTKKKK